MTPDQFRAITRNLDSLRDSASRTRRKGIYVQALCTRGNTPLKGKILELLTRLGSVGGINGITIKDLRDLSDLAHETLEVEAVYNVTGERKKLEELTIDG